MTIWIPKLVPGTPKHRALADAIAAAIVDGTLPAGTQMPPQRELAFALGLSLGTVTRAYRSAEARGLLTGEVGRGTFVKGGAAPVGNVLFGPVRQSDDHIGLVMNLPPKVDAGARLEATLQAIARDGSADFLVDHQVQGRIEAHARSATSWLQRVGLAAAPENIVITNGAQHGLLTALMTLARPGDVILAERLTYPALNQMAHCLGLKTQPVELDEEGLCPDSLDEACRRTGARVLYCMPTLHSPTGTTMSAERRGAIAAIADRHDLQIIEDDVFGFLPEDRPPPLAQLAPDRTIYVTSASKCMAPGLRIGMMLVPARWRETIRNVVQMSCWMPSPLTAEIVHRWIEDGTADALNQSMRLEMSARLDMAHETLGSAIATQLGLRFHLWLSLPDGWSEEAFVGAAAARGVKIAAGSLFLLKPSDASRHARIALGYETDRTRLQRGLTVLAELMATHPMPGPAIV
ncbi:PLP-dependent aminotransferase family protein [Dongia sp.]|uniref:aminotransferase-like domain-containing protein n=1 Tax=Dongia sp. TaxID=1977262 RepID=UPI0035B01B50